MAILALVFQDTLRKWMSDFLIETMKGYRDDIDLQNLIDSMQKVVRTRARRSRTPLSDAQTHTHTEMFGLCQEPFLHAQLQM